MKLIDVLYMLNFLHSEDGLSILLNGSVIEEFLPLEKASEGCVLVVFRGNRRAEISLSSDQLCLVVKGER